MFCRKKLLKNHKIQVKKNPVESMVHGIFWWKKVGMFKLDLTWILHFSGSMTRGTEKNEKNLFKGWNLPKAVDFSLRGDSVYGIIISGAKRFHALF